MYHDVTQLLSASDQGDPHAASRLLLVYDELSRLAAERMAQEPGQTLQPTARIHRARDRSRS
jgi:hypothetical protein